MVNKKQPKTSTRKPHQVEVRDLKPTGDAKGGATKKGEASFLLKENGGFDPNAQKKEEEGI